MTLYETNSREYRRVTRVWFACDGCDLRGDFTVDKGGESVGLADLAAIHVCAATAPRPVCRAVIR